MTYTINYFYIFLLLLFSIFGCQNDTETITLNIVFDKAVEGEKYPPYLKDFVMPFSSTCEKDYLLKPINFVRSDIKKTQHESNAWYFQDFGDNTVEFSKGWLEFYFNDSIVDPYLSQKTGTRQTGVKKMIENQEFLYIFSEDSELENFQGKTIFSNAKDLHNVLKEDACKNTSGKITILVNPSEIMSLDGNQVSEDEDEDGDESKILTKNPCENVVSMNEATNLLNDLQNVINPENDIVLRRQKAEEVWNTYFSDQAYVATPKFKGDQNPEIWDPGEGEAYFVSRLAILESLTKLTVTRMEMSKTSGKISGIHIIECHDAVEIL